MVLDVALIHEAVHLFSGGRLKGLATEASGLIRHARNWGAARPAGPTRKLAVSTTFAI